MSTTRTLTLARSCLIICATCPVPNTVTSVASPPSAAKAVAAPTAGPPAAMNCAFAVIFSLGPGGAPTRWMMSSVATRRTALGVAAGELPRYCRALPALLEAPCCFGFCGTGGTGHVGHNIGHCAFLWAHHSGASTESVYVNSICDLKDVGHIVANQHHRDPPIADGSDELNHLP